MSIHHVDEINNCLDQASAIVEFLGHSKENQVSDEAPIEAANAVVDMLGKVKRLVSEMYKEGAK